MTPLSGANLATKGVGYMRSWLRPLVSIDIFCGDDMRVEGIDSLIRCGCL